MSGNRIAFYSREPNSQRQNFNDENSPPPPPPQAPPKAPPKASQTPQALFAPRLIMGNQFSNYSAGTYGL